mgnify:CR=1 FL=1
MKKYNKWIFNVASGLALTSVIATSCVDEIKFGNSFLEKAPGGSVTKDTVFNNAEYTRQFLTNLYGMQYYGLPYKNVANQESSNQYVGKPEALTDLYVFTYPSCGISGPYYKGTHTANYGKRSDKFDYLRNNVWEAVRGVWMLIENIDNVPVTFAKLTDDEQFWAGCKSCVNYDILLRTNMTKCLCTGMVYDPEVAAKREADKKLEEKKQSNGIVKLLKKVI